MFHLFAFLCLAQARKRSDFPLLAESDWEWLRCQRVDWQPSSRFGGSGLRIFVGPGQALECRTAATLFDVSAPRIPETAQNSRCPCHNFRPVHAREEGHLGRRGGRHSERFPQEEHNTHSHNARTNRIGTSLLPAACSCRSARADRKRDVSRSSHAPRRSLSVFVVPQVGQLLAKAFCYLATLLKLCGNIEPHPGPRQDLLEDPLAERLQFRTLRLYAQQVMKLDTFLRIRSLPDIVTLARTDIARLTSLTVLYIRTEKALGHLTVGNLGHLISGLKQVLLLLAQEGLVTVQPKQALFVLWQVYYSWLAKQPFDTRNPIPPGIALALVGAMLCLGSFHGALCVSLMHHGIARPEEILSVLWSEVAVFHGAMEWMFAGASPAVINIAKAKTRFSRKHSRLQHVVIECEILDAVLTVGKRTFASTQALWPFNRAAFDRLWLRAIRLLQLEGINITPAGLRAGGAVSHYIQYRNVPLLRRRGRWRSEETLEHYLQEAAYYMTTLAIPEESMEQVYFHSDLASQVFGALASGEMVFADLHDFQW